MSFKRIEVSGFKSFADRLDIKFDKGITAIVGPNGCGKSNVADAIRWVLGEQSPKLLRGSNMQDVIFKGSETRKGLSFCEVSLVFDNTDHTFNTDYDEVVITRKLFRSGEREYALNRTPCLLKDITNLLHDSGIGRDGYSIIGQGKVEEIISSKPENRRAIFEEAAGIAKFKSRKEEAERSLDRTRDAMTRTKDIMTERERQLGPLKKQAEDARKYLAYKEELKHYEVNNYIYHHESANQVKRAIQDKIDGYNQEVALKNAQIEDCNTRNTQSMDTIKEIDAQINVLREQILTLTVDIEKQAGDQRLAQEKMNYMKEQISRIQEELDADKLRFQSINTELESKQQDRNSHSEELKNLQSKADEMQNIYLQVLEELKALETEADSSQKKIFAEFDKLSDIKAQASRLDAEYDSLNERENELKLRKESLSERLEILKKAENQAEQERNRSEQERKETFNKLTAIKENYAQIEKENKENQIKLSYLNNKLASMESREKLLNEMHAEYEGFNGTVRKLLVDSGKNPELKRSIVGVVAELIKVPKQYETAIEMALGAGVQNIVTNNEEDAKKLVSYLKAKSYGRATFLPINSLKPKFINDQFKANLKSNGVYGIACDLIQFDSKLEPIFKGLLGSTVIVENMDIAVKLAKDTKFSFKIVTLEGDIINPAGSITGGSKKAEINNLLSREREIETIAKDIKNLQAEIETMHSTINKYNSKMQELLNSIEELNKNLQDCEIALSNKETILKSASERSLELSNEIQSVQDELSRLVTKKEYLNSEIENIKKVQSTDGLDVSKQGSMRTQRAEQLREQRDKLSETLTDLRVQIATIESEITSLDENIQRLLNEQSVLNENIDENTSLLAKNKQTMETAMQLDANKDLTSLGQEEQKVSQIREQVAEYEKTKDQIHEMLKLIGEERDRITIELSKAQERLFQEEAKLGQIDVNIEAMKEKIFEDYELTYNTALALKDENYDNQEGQKRISELKKSISALGYVNVNAIEDSKILEESYNEYVEKMEDLTKTESDILSIIKDLSEQMTAKFEAEFEQINNNFTKIFRELFNGGNARLVLTDSDDILTAGIDIIAEPPGKKLQNLSLLSGGEKALTAIAILFAILKLRPMPFCLLDEIEAALDDANVERFAKYLHRFAQETQFIVITHRKPTMELADSLFGVTMEEKGVSKIVSIKLSDAIKATEAK